MQFRIAALAFAVAVTAQSVSDLPKCAVSCLPDALQGTNCKADDLKCICKNQQKVGEAAAPCVVESCGMIAAESEVLPAAKKLCESVNGGQ
ncbi:hypothetical protein F4780DRAFT_571181 [Xylariomycetidae sp. FL0641]|nr:hypothetical protein F4780DRAFT_571181 [Xylariomycetidae sp. FL0641]